MQVNTQILEIPKATWPMYFRTFNELHQGWATTVEIMANDLGDQPEAAGLPFRGVSFESKGSDRGDILVEVGDIEPAYITHRIHRPHAVRVSDTQPGNEADMQVESDGGIVTLIRLRQLPELPPASAT